MKETDCYKCGYKGNNPGSAHIRCRFDWAKSGIKMPMGNPHGVRNGWFIFPLNYDPTWMIGECLSFAEKPDPNMVKDKHDPLMELAAIFASVGR